VKKDKPAAGPEPLPVWIFLAVYIAFSILLFDPKLFTGGDNATYIILAESLASGKGFSNINLPGTPGNTQYPPGFPLLLVPLVLLFGANILALKFLIVLTGIGAMFFIHRIAVRVFKERSVYLMSLSLTLPMFITYNHWVLSEMPFLFFSLGAVYFIMLQGDRRSLAFTLIAVGCAVFSFFIRTSGISLIAAIALYFFLKKDYRSLGLLIILFLAAFIPWSVRNARIPSEGSYLDQLLAKNPYQMELGRASAAEFAGRIADNFVLYFFNILPLAVLAAVSASWLRTLIGLILLGLSIAGFIRRIRAPAVQEWYLIFGLAVLLLWPSVWSSDRFLLPLLPFFLVYLYEALFWLCPKLRIKHLVTAATAVMIALNLFALVPQMRATVTDTAGYLHGDRYAGYKPDWRRYFEAVDWIKENIPQDRIIMARKPEFVYLLSRHKSLIYPFTENRDKVRQAIDQCDFILLDNFYWTQTTRRYLWPVLQQSPEGYEIVHQTRKPEFYVLKIIK
jgi:hypothetical protein